MRKIFHAMIVAILSVAGAVSFGSIQGTADAHAGEVHTEDTALTQTQNDPQANQSTTANYEYNVAAGYNMSILARRSVQLYDETNDDLTLTNPAVIYAETNIVQELGPRHLAVGERFVVPYKMVESYAASSQQLSDRVLSLWEKYARRASFSTSHINPVSGGGQSDANQDGSAGDDPGDENVTSEEGSADEEANNNGTAGEEAAGDSESDQDENGSNLIWTILALVVLLVLWQLVNRRQDEASSDSGSGSKKKK